MNGKERHDENQNARIYVDDQETALKVYAEKLLFTKKADFSNHGYRWLTVVSAEDLDHVMLKESAIQDDLGGFRGARRNFAVVGSPGFVIAKLAEPAVRGERHFTDWNDVADPSPNAHF